ncbi:enoyl-CoA hydratase/isomerase family protein [Streptomyces cavernicola]|uniref:3-hydroxyisobutyryl-CoA hydrolase n=1 Tax=Streptomyces cavernicola TaxID=3043613 RepID=A0ABT6SEY7_9ACTN|nr:enoyl-CoA hydratase/isomerase family protein [Streptomyces sp. B-S-A6]MDI3406756.1 enoyl-CoA hydratase/isomerase family protein [Streptomyces sp. B-S-A6]
MAEVGGVRGASAGRDGADVLVEVRGSAGWLTLNRPRALNALTHGMVRLIDAALARWEQDERIAYVVLDGAGERGLCAGGDIRAIRDSALTDDGEAARAFWRDEYRLNARIARFPKPYVALMDGIVMGGGVGLSAHGDVRIVTERSRVAMPEAGIGFVPDVGGTRLLGRAPGELGTHLALTADAMTGPDALYCGFADHFVPSERLPALRAALDGRQLADVLDAFTVPAPLVPESPLAQQRTWIDACYGPIDGADCGPAAEEIVDRLADCGEGAAKEAAVRILGHSPTAVKVTLQAVRRARALGTLDAVLDQEYRVSCAALTGPDFVEGVRAKLVDKDGEPRWSPGTLGEVTAEAVERHFEQHFEQGSQ